MYTFGNFVYLKKISVNQINSQKYSKWIEIGDNLIDRRIYEIDPHKKLLNWIAFHKKFIVIELSLSIRLGTP